LCFERCCDGFRVSSDDLREIIHARGEVRPRRLHAGYVIAIRRFVKERGREDARRGVNRLPGVFVCFDGALVDARELAVARKSHRGCATLTA